MPMPQPIETSTFEGILVTPGSLIDGKSIYQRVPVGDLHDDPDNPRKTYRNIIPLSENLDKMGMLQPIVARIAKEDGCADDCPADHIRLIGNKLIIMYGHRRIRAARLAGWSHVPVLVRYGVRETSVLARQLAENTHRDNMDPMDEARGLRRYMHEQKLATYQQAAESLGTSLTWVTNRAQLLNLGQDDQEKVSRRELGIVAGAAKARKETGNTRKTSHSSEAGHFTQSHPLASVARARCRAKGASHGGRIVGAVACGPCWEEAIRNDATRKFALTGKNQ